MYRTFEGFLRSYLGELSGTSTGSLRTLCYKAQGNARLVEPLLLYARVQGKIAYLLDVSEGCWFHEEYQTVAAQIETFDSLQAFLQSGSAPKRYAAVYDAFLAQGDLLAADRRMNALMRPRILKGLKNRGLSRYRLCKDLGLNMGNVYAYLSGDDAKVSHKTASSMLAYVDGIG